MIDQSIRKRYFRLVRKYISAPGKSKLSSVAEVGRELVAADVSPAEIAELHKAAIGKLGKEFSDARLVDAVSLVSAPFIELISAYGVAVREQMEHNRRALDTLRVSEERYRQSIENSPNPIFSVNKNGEIQLWNQSCETFFQYSSGEIIGHHYSRLLSDSFNADAFEKTVQEAWSGNVQRNIDITYRCKDGSHRYTVSRLYSVYDSCGKAGECVFANTDITESKQSETNFRNIFNLTSDAIFIKDKNLRIIDANKAAEELFGFTHDELLARPEKTLGDREKNDYKMADKYVKAALRGIPQRFEWWGLKKDGTSFPEDMLINKSVYNGKDVLLFTIRDISERKKAEEALRDSEMRFRTIFESYPIGVLLTSPEGKFIHVNRYFQDMLMYNDEELKVHFRDITHPDDIEKSMIVLEKLLNGEIQSAKFEKRYIKKNGEAIQCNINVAPVKKSANEIEYFITTVEDITELKRAERRIKKQLDELQRWHRLMLDREDRVMELKREVNELLKLHGQPIRYPSQESVSGEESRNKS